MAALDSSSIIVAEFVVLTLPAITYRYTNASAPVTVDGEIFNNLGSLMSISDVQNGVKANSADLTIAITGIDPDNVNLVLSADIKGSKIELYRGFLDSNNQIITTPTQQFFRRYSGIINNFAISEEFNDDMRIRVATCTLSSSSMRTVLENRNAGLKTNAEVWKSFYPNDASMDRVATIATTYFDFGKAPLGGAVNSNLLTNPT